MKGTPRSIQIKEDRSLKGVVSVVLPMYNEAETIGECVKSLLQQSYPNIEIAIVDDGSTDNSVDVVQKHLGKEGANRIRVIESKHRGRSHARNLGIKSSVGDILVFAEADAKYDERYVENIVKPFLQDPSIGGVMGYGHAWDTTKWLARLHEGAWSSTIIKRYRHPSAWAYRRDVLLQAGLFDERLDFGEDLDLGARVRKLGYRIVFEPSAVWWHKYPDTISLMLKRRFDWGVNIWPFYLKQKRVPPHILVVLFLLLSLLFRGMFQIPYGAFLVSLYLCLMIGEMWFRRILLLESDKPRQVFLWALLDLHLIKPAELIGLLVGLLYQPLK